MKRNILIVCTAIVLAVAVAALAPSAALGATVETVADVRVAGSTFMLTPDLLYQRAVLRIAGPEGFALTKRFENGSAVVADLVADRELSDGDPAAAAGAQEEHVPAMAPRDGQYYYEVVLIGDSGDIRAQRGGFVLHDGEVVAGATPRGNVGGMAVAQPALESTQVGRIRGVDHPEPGHFGESVDIFDADEDGRVGLSLHSSGHHGWELSNHEGGVRLEPFNPETDDVITVLPGGRVGIGTTAPLTGLHIVDNPVGLGSPAVRLEWPSGRVALLGLHSEGHFSISLSGEPDAGFGVRFRITRDAPKDAIRITGDGVGIGLGALAATPGADLDLRDMTDDGRTNIRFAVADHAWTNAIPESSGNFIFNRQGTGGPEFVVTKRFDPAGTLVVHGTVNELSTRAIKTDFAAVDPADVLSRLAALPINTWRYREDSSGEVHMGPVAEDFRRFFGLGDGRSIPSTDARGVVMAAIQGLKQQFDAKVAEVAEVQARNAELEARLVALEAHLGLPTQVAD